jgi:tight adherence protein B
MSALLIAFLVFVVVALAIFAVLSLFDSRRAQARLIKDRLATVQKAPEREPDEELALLRDEQLSEIPALDSLLRRSARVSAIQESLLQAGMKFRAGNFLVLCMLSGALTAFAALVWSRNPAITWAALIIGAFLPYALVSYRRQKRFEKIEELFPEAIDTLARAVRAGHAFTTALETKPPSPWPANSANSMKNRNSACRSETPS